MVLEGEDLVKAPRPATPGDSGGSDSVWCQSEVRAESDEIGSRMDTKHQLYVHRFNNDTFNVKDRFHLLLSAVLDLIKTF